MPTLTIGDDANLVINPPEKKAEAKAPEEKEMTAEEIQALAKTTADSLFGAPTPKPKKETDAEKAKKEEDEKAAAEAKKKQEDEAAAKRKTEEPAKSAPKPKAAKASAPTADEIAEKVADRLKPAEKAADSGPKLSEEDQRNRDIFQEMALAKPEEYGQHVQKFDKFVTAEAAYKAKWAKENPGAEFDADDEAHKQFYGQNEPTYFPEDYDDARITLRARKIAEQTVNDRDQRRAFDEAKKVATEKLATVEQSVITDLAREVDPELVKLKDLPEEDPLADFALRPHIGKLAAMSAELIKAFTPGLNYRFTDANPLQVEIIAKTYEYEGELLALPLEQQIAADGRKLAAIEDYNKMSPEQRRKHWSIWLEPNAVRALLIRDAGNEARANLTKLRERIEKKRNGTAQPATPKPAEPQAAKPAPAAAKTEFPNTGGGAESVAATPDNGVVDAGLAKKITTELFGS